MAVEAITREETIDPTAVFDGFARLGVLRHSIEVYSNYGEQALLDELATELDETLVGREVTATALDPYANSITRCFKMGRSPREDEPVMQMYGTKSYFSAVNFRPDVGMTQGKIRGIDIANQSLIVAPKSLWHPFAKDWVRLVDQDGQALVSLEFPQPQA